MQASFILPPPILVRSPQLFLKILLICVFVARGGFVVSVVRDLGLPIQFIGVGEKITDLREFEPAVFVDALLGNDEVASAKMKAKVRTHFCISWS